MRRHLVVSVLVVATVVSCGRGDPVSEPAPPSSAVLEESTPPATTAPTAGTSLLPPLVLGVELPIDAVRMTGPSFTVDGWIVAGCYVGICFEPAETPSGFEEGEGGFGGSVFVYELEEAGLRSNQADRDLPGWIDRYVEMMSATHGRDTPQLTIADPRPHRIGTLDGYRFMWAATGPEGGFWEEGFVAVDDALLYLISFRSEIADEGIPELPNVVREVVSSLRIPPDLSVAVPAALDGWELQPADLLLAGPEGVQILRSDGSAWTNVGTITTTPVISAAYDGGGGLVVHAIPLTPAGDWHCRVSGGELWWIPGEGTEPVLVHDPAYDLGSRLYGVAAIASDPVVVYESWKDADASPEQWISLYHLETGDRRDLAMIGAGEVHGSSVAWTGDLFLVAGSAETTAWFNGYTISGDEVPAPGLELEPGEEATVAVGADGDTTVYAQQDWEKPVVLTLVTPAGSRRVEMEPVPEGDSLCGISVSGDLAAVSFARFPGPPVTYVVDLSTGLPITGPLEGTASFVAR